MNIQIGTKAGNTASRKLKSLNESQQNNVVVETSQEADILRIKSKNIEFSNGVIMAKISEDIGTKFGLKHHYYSTENIEQFIDSVKNFAEIAGGELNASDLKKLELQYNSVN